MDSRRRAELLASLSPEGRATYEVLRAHLARDLDRRFAESEEAVETALGDLHTKLDGTIADLRWNRRVNGERAKEIVAATAPTPPAWSEASTTDGAAASVLAATTANTSTPATVSAPSVAALDSTSPRVQAVTATAPTAPAASHDAIRLRCDTIEDRLTSEGRRNYDVLVGGPAAPTSAGSDISIVPPASTIVDVIPAAIDIDHDMVAVCHATLTPTTCWTIGHGFSNNSICVREVSAALEGMSHAAQTPTKGTVKPLLPVLKVDLMAPVKCSTECPVVGTHTMMPPSRSDGTESATTTTVILQNTQLSSVPPRVQESVWSSAQLDAANKLFDENPQHADVDHVALLQLNTEQSIVPTFTGSQPAPMRPMFSWEFGVGVIGIVDITELDAAVSRKVFKFKVPSIVDRNSHGIGDERRPPSPPPELVKLYIIGVQCMQPTNAHFEASACLEQLRTFMFAVRECTDLNHASTNLPMMVVTSPRLEDGQTSDSECSAWVPVEIPCASSDFGGSRLVIGKLIKPPGSKDTCEILMDQHNEFGPILLGVPVVWLFSWECSEDASTEKTSMNSRNLLLPNMNEEILQANSIAICFCAIDQIQWKNSLMLSHTLISEIGAYFALEKVSKNDKLGSEFVQLEIAWTIHLTSVQSLFTVCFAGCHTLYSGDNFQWTIAWSLGSHSHVSRFWARQACDMVQHNFPSNYQGRWFRFLMVEFFHMGASYFFSDLVKCSVDQYIQLELLLQATALSPMENSIIVIIHLSLLLPYSTGGCAITRGHLQDIPLPMQHIDQKGRTLRKGTVLHVPHLCLPWDPGDSNHGVEGVTLKGGMRFPWDPGGLSRCRLEGKPKFMGEGLSATWASNQYPAWPKATREYKYQGKHLRTDWLGPDGGFGR